MTCRAFANFTAPERRQMGERARAGSDHRAIHAAVEALDLASKPFAERRMNRSIERAVAGRRVDEVEQKL